jgi:hypothetical protein
VKVALSTLQACEKLTVLPPSDGLVTVVLPGEQDLTRLKVVGEEVELLPRRASTHQLILHALGL